jgi:hypothetical protein
LSCAFSKARKAETSAIAETRRHRIEIIVTRKSPAYAGHDWRHGRPGDRRYGDCS